MEQLEKALELLEGPLVLHLGLCGADLTPHSIRLTGIQLEAAGIVKVYALEAVRARVQRIIEENEQLSVLLVNPLSYVSYQLKGLCLKLEDCSPLDYELQERCFSQLKKAAFPARFYNINRSPTFAIVIKISEVYNQSPGPRAGTLI